MAEYAIVSTVTIEQVDDKNVSFRTRSASRSGHPDDSLLKLFTCPLTEVWTQPIAGSPMPVAMVAGARGDLYLSREGWQTRSADGYKIYGADTDLPMFKFPDVAASLRMLSDLVVVPSRIAVHGTIDNGTRVVDIDLLGAEAAAAQDFECNGATEIAIRLSAAGSLRLYGRADQTTVRVWPTQIVVSGYPEVDRSISGEVDILNGELAAQVQHIAFATPGAAIKLKLTQDGIGAFHLVPGLSQASG